MIRVIFEFNEEVLDVENLMKGAREDNNVDSAQILIGLIGSALLKREVEKGKNEFLVTEEKLDEKSKRIYSNVLPGVCTLAAYSETDKP